MRDLKESLSLSVEEARLLERCRQAIYHLDPSAEVILYGSRARGEAGPESDYDLLVMTDAPVNLKAEDVIRRSLYPIELETSAVLTVLLVKRTDMQSALYAAMPFYQNIERDGLRL